MNVGAVVHRNAAALVSHRAFYIRPLGLGGLHDRSDDADSGVPCRSLRVRLQSI